MSLLDELKEIMDNQKTKLIEKGKKDWPAKFKDSLATRALSLYNSLTLTDNYFYLYGVRDCAQKDGFKVFLTKANDNHVAQLTISW